MRFFFPFNATTVRVHLPWAYLTQYVPLSGFLNLLAAYSSNRFGVLFRTPYAHGIHPSEFSPREQHLLLVEFDYLRRRYYASIAGNIHAIAKSNTSVPATCVGVRRHLCSTQIQFRVDTVVPRFTSGFRKIHQLFKVPPEPQ
jgi:hypothetical protein